APPPPAPTPLPPAAPTGVIATAGNAQVQLTWSAVSGASSYTVKYSTASGGPYQIAGSPLTSTTFTHAGLTNGTTYYYVVSATGDGGEGTNSVQVSAKPVAPPTQATIAIWWPTNGAKISGTQPFKARIGTLALSDYTMYWQVDGDKLN